jgi:hypothetical protein
MLEDPKEQSKLLKDTYKFLTILDSLGYWRILRILEELEEYLGRLKIPENSETSTSLDNSELGWRTLVD